MPPNLSIKILWSNTDSRNFHQDWRKILDEFPSLIKNYCLSFHFEKDQKKHSLGYHLLSQLLNQNSNLDLSSVIKVPGRKPRLTDSTQFFNISYSSKYALAALSNQPIGVDIEKKDEKINLNHYKSVFSDRSWQAISNAPSPINTFYNYWTKMEAVAKCKGIGITGPIHNIIYEEDFVSWNSEKYYVTPIYCAEEISAHIACQSPFNAEIPVITSL